MGSTNNYKLEFLAEIGPVTSRKLVSLDREHKVTFVTQESNVLELASLDSELLVKVTVEIAE